MLIICWGIGGCPGIRPALGAPVAGGEICTRFVRMLICAYRDFFGVYVGIGSIISSSKSPPLRSLLDK